MLEHDKSALLVGILWGGINISLEDTYDIRDIAMPIDYIYEMHRKMP